MRLALAHATDKQQIIDVLRHVLAALGLTLIPVNLDFWFNHSLAAHAYDPDLANQILDQAGYLDTDGDGVREMPGSGEPLIFPMHPLSSSPISPPCWW